MSKIVFGPVNSRRFGLSLGLDLSPSSKQCNFDCVYCELSPKKAMSAQVEVVGVEDILSELKQVLENGVKFDYITLTANGEPSLYPHLKELISSLKAIKKDKKLLILSNGTAVLQREKFEALLELDVVKLSLDSVIEKTFFRIDKAFKDIDLKCLIEKMMIFSKEFKGELVMEVLVVAGLNDNELEFKALNEVFKQIKPTRVDISTIDRPPAYPVKGVSSELLEYLATFITTVPCVIASRNFKGDKIDFSEDELLKILALRPQSEFDVRAKFSDFSKQNLQRLLNASKIKTQELAGVIFYRS